MSIDRTQLSRFLSLILRHKPDAIGLDLDSQGWADIEQMIDKAHAAGTKFDRNELLHVVETSDKKRFSGLGRPATHSGSPRAFSVGRTWVVVQSASARAVSRDRDAVC